MAYMTPHEIDEKVTGIYRKLFHQYPKESCGSAASLFNVGLKNGDITREDYDLAEKYYGKLWSYAGD
jgi:hypothetical protein